MQPSICEHLQGNRCLVAERLVTIHTGHDLQVKTFPANCELCRSLPQPKTVNRATVGLAIYNSPPEDKDTVLSRLKQFTYIEEPKVRTVLPGVGTLLEKIFKEVLGAEKTKECDCEYIIDKMNLYGPKWCVENLDSLTYEIRQSAKKSGRFLHRVAAKIGIFTDPVISSYILDAVSQYRQMTGESVAIVPLFNPCGYERRTYNYLRSIKQYETLGFDRVLTVEAVTEGHKSVAVGDKIVIDCSSNQILWQKERLINIGIESLFSKPPSVVAWLDADLIYTHPIIHMINSQLANLDVVQLFRSCTLLDKHGLPESERSAFFSPKRKRIIHSPGFGWAANWEAVSKGLYDCAVLGTGDLYNLFGWAKRNPSPTEHQMTPAMLRGLERWSPDSKLSIGYLPDVNVSHRWHGEYDDRGYHTRGEILQRHEFDPATDLRLASNGLWEWAGNKPALAKEVADYFFSRKEDGSEPVPSSSSCNANRRS